jgi:hypothetical protein
MRPVRPLSDLSRRDLLTAGTGAMAALGLPLHGVVSGPASRVAIVRCRNYGDFSRQLSSAFDKIGGIEKLVKGKTVAVKLNLTGNPARFPLTPDLPYRTDAGAVANTVHLLAAAGAKRVRIIESFFPASQDLGLWARYGLDVNAINNLGTKVEERSKHRQLQKIRSFKGPVGRLCLPGLPYQSSLYGMRRVCFAFEA